MFALGGDLYVEYWKVFSLFSKLYHYNIYKMFLANAKCPSWISLRPALPRLLLAVEFFMPL